MNQHKIKFLKEAEDEIKQLDNNLFLKVSKMLVKLSNDPIAYSEPLGNKMNMNLTGLRKTYVDGKRIRIVFLVLENRLIILVIAVNKRDKGKVYQITQERIDAYNSLLQRLKNPDLPLNDILGNEDI
ncbi:MAG: type II toxin-antitoxin system RelE family toxin [Bacillota bacterium]